MITIKDLPVGSIVRLKLEDSALYEVCDHSALGSRDQVQLRLKDGRNTQVLAELDLKILEQAADVIDKFTKPEVPAEDARLDELLERLVAPGQFPNMSASEGHELYELVTSALGKKVEAV